MALVYISLINTDVEHPLMCLAICMTSVAKCLLRSSVHLNFFFFLVLLHSMWDLSSPIRNQNLAPYSGSMKS